MAVSRDDIVREARNFIGTPYLHQGRLFKKGVDCGGLVVMVARSLSLFEHDDLTYSDQPKADYLLRECDKFLDPKPLDLQQLQPGDVGAFYYMSPTEAQHLCIFGEYEGRLTMIHAFQKRGKVVEHTFDDFWAKRLLKVYSYRGVTE